MAQQRFAEEMDQVDAQETYRKVREQYRSVLKFCAHHNFSSQLFYAAVTGARGKSNAAIESRQIIELLKKEGLLVVNTTPTTAGK